MADIHLAQMVADRAKANPDVVAFRVKSDGAYRDIRWKDAWERVENIASGLLTALDLPHAAAVSIIGDTSLEWVLCDYACQWMGLQSVPIYATLQPDEVGYMHVDTGVVLAIAENLDQLEKIRAMRQGFRFCDVDYAPERVRVSHIIVIDPTGIEPAEDWESLQDLETRGAEHRERVFADGEARRAKIQRSDIATYTYTSGTTGAPKAVIQTHDNVLSMLESVDRTGLFNDLVRAGGLLLFLPLAHSFGRLVQQSGPYFLCPLAMSTIPELGNDLRDARPGFFPAAPRVYEKMKARIESAVAVAAPHKRAMFAWAMAVGRRTLPYRAKGCSLPLWMRPMVALADRLVHAKLRTRLGLDRAGLAMSGSAPLAVDVHTFFLAAGIPLVEAYGLTETCPGLTTNLPHRFRMGTVGQAFDGMEVAINPDGEIKGRGPNITPGYLNRPEATAAAFDEDGWFLTGDLGSIDDDGFVKITGRKKELIKTAGGKFVAPIKVEALVKRHPLIQEAVVIGDRRPYCVALVAVDPEELEAWSEQRGIDARLDDAQVMTSIDEHVRRINEGLARFETVKAFRVLPEPVTVENGCLTASLKVRRQVVEERYASLISDMYAATTGSSETDAER